MTERNNQLFRHIVKEFYHVATTDFLIGYQFRKIQTKEGLNPLLPPIEAFESHLPRIEKFWRMILLGERLEDSPPFDLIGVHRNLRIRKGELDRWVLLFNQTLEDNVDQLGVELKDDWIEKVEIFRGRFTKVLFS